ncbi:MAG: hypothetical protein MI717_03160 [Spirochaetales bacterium]|nr:hypothetical protein [Spirochaetales bacterium]
MTTASIRNNRLNLLAKRAGYNLALRHFRTTQEFAADVADGYNLADLLNTALSEEQIEENQIRPILNILLAEKYGYVCASENLKDTVANIDALSKAVDNWTNIQVVFIYTDANGGLHLLNPEVPEPWEAALPLAKDEHIVCYVGSPADVRREVLDGAIKDAYALLYGGKVRARAGYRSSQTVKLFLSEAEEESPVASSIPAFEDGESSTASSHESEESDAPAAAPPPPTGGSRKLTAKVAVNVTNELFHNGNVEAWKRIIQSYRFKYPALDVLIWYEGERINDINALFKWGKVKHGVPIMFSVAGDEPKELSKLRKYLFEGASSRFEAFLHGAPGTILQLF